MNRKIVFRGKCAPDTKYAGEWVTGGYVPLSEGITPNDEGLIMRFLGGDITITYHVVPNTIGQFTGLQDSNGTDIYEGDILKDKDWEVFEDKKSFVVSFDEISPRFLLGRTDGRSSIFQLDATFANRSVIIANIHDNPELLKGGGK